MDMTAITWVLGLLSTLLCAGVVALVKLGLQVTRLEQWREGHEKLMTEKLDSIGTNVGEVKQLCFLALSIKQNAGPKVNELLVDEMVKARSHQ